MILTIAVDANPILAALLGGYARVILFEPRFSFITTSFTIDEVQKHLPTIADQSGVSVAELKEALVLLPLTVYARSHYQSSLSEARRRMDHIDATDTDILALAIFAEAPVWTNDRHFEKVQPPIPFLKTRDFVL